MRSVGAALVLLHLAACTNWGAYEGTRPVSMWERNAPGAPVVAEARALSD